MKLRGAKPQTADPEQFSMDVTSDLINIDKHCLQAEVNMKTEYVCQCLMGHEYG